MKQQERHAQPDRLANQTVCPPRVLMDKKMSNSQRPMQLWSTLSTLSSHLRFMPPTACDMATRSLTDSEQETPRPSRHNDTTKPQAKRCCSCIPCNVATPASCLFQTTASSLLTQQPMSSQHNTSSANRRLQTTDTLATDSKPQTPLRQINHHLHVFVATELSRCNQDPCYPVTTSHSHLHNAGVQASRPEQPLEASNATHSHKRGAR